MTESQRLFKSLKGKGKDVVFVNQVKDLYNYPSACYDIVENALKTLEKESETQEIKRPENWGGFLVVPHQIEFWQGRPNRLHDRIRYTLKEDSSWKMERLAP